MAAYINHNAAMASSDVIYIDLETIAGDQAWFSGTIYRITSTSDDQHEVKFVAQDEKMTMAGAKSRAEDLAAHDGLPISLRII